MPVSTTTGTLGELMFTMAKVSNPLLSGNPRSKRTTSVPPAARRSSAVESRSAHSGATGSLVRASISWISRTSSSLSSIRMTRISSPLISGNAGNQGPVNFELPHHFLKLLRDHRLGDVRANPVRVRFHDIFLPFAGSEYDDWKMPKRRIRLELIQNLKAILLWHVDVE